MKTHFDFKLASLVATIFAALAGVTLVRSVHAQAVPIPVSATSTPLAAKPAASNALAVPVKKDIVADSIASPQATPLQTTGALVPTPGAKPASTPKPPRRFTAAAHNTATTGALAELGLDLMRQQSLATGKAQVNSVVSPLSLVSALGLVHAGTTGDSARELATLLGTASAGDRIYTARIPVLLDQLTKPGTSGSPFVMANRVWLDDTVTATILPSYAAAVTDRLNADAAIVQFSQAAVARKAINTWISQKTANRVPALMPDGSITPNTKLVLTNAIHFKSKWAEPFDVAKTVSKPFQIAPNENAKPIPTMVDERQVRLGTIDNITVIELPFAGDQFSLMVGVPPVGHTLNAFETDLEGLDIASWSSQLKLTTCRLELPKFTIEPATTPLKTSLQALGVKTVFGPNANFEPMLGKTGKSIALDNVYQSATIIIDEQGGEAAAATGAAAVSKSFAMPGPVCAVDRPFIFAVIHRATGTPLFIGKVADPSQH